MPVFAARYIVSGGGVVDTSDAAAMRTALGLGSAAVAASTAFALSSHTQAASTITGLGSAATVSAATFAAASHTHATTQIAGATTTGQVLLSLTDGTFTAARLTAGSNITLTHGSGSLVIAAGGGGGTSNPVFPGLIPLTGMKYVRAFVPNAGSGNVDVYTAPTGKRAMINAHGVYNTTGSSISFYPALKVSGSYYKLKAALSCSANSPNQAATSVCFILEPGETFAINTTGAGLNIHARVVEYDNTVPLYMAKKYASWSSGDNTIYTVPANTHAILVDGVGGVQQNTTSLNYYNSSGGSVTIIWYSVASGQSVGSTYQVGASTSIANDAASNVVVSHTLSAGDFISLNVNSASNTQVAWVVVAEVAA